MDMTYIQLWVYSDRSCVQKSASLSRKEHVNKESKSKWQQQCVAETRSEITACGQASTLLCEYRETVWVISSPSSSKRAGGGRRIKLVGGFGGQGKPRQLEVQRIGTKVADGQWRAFESPEQRRFPVRDPRLKTTERVRWILQGSYQM